MRSLIEQEYLDDLLAAKYPAESFDGMQLAAADTGRLPEVFVTGEPEKPTGAGGPAGVPEPTPKPTKKPVPAPMQATTGEIKPIQPSGGMGALKTVGELIQSGAEKIDFDVLGLPGIGTLTLKDLTVGDLGKVLVNIAEGFPPVTGSGQTLSPTIESAELLNLAPLATTAYQGGKALAKGVVSGAKSLAPVAGEMVEGYMRKTGGLMDVAPSKFNPATELPKAVDTVATNPDLKIYLPQAQRAPSVALRLAGVPIDGTGQKGTITVNDVGIILEKSQLALNKNKPLDPTKPKDLAKMVDSATAEAEYQMSQPISGATWYEDDVHQAFMLGSKIIPELATDEPLRVMTTAFSASTSYNKRAGENWPVALRITEHLMKTGQMASRNPDNGKLWGGTTGPIMEQQLKLHDYMIKRMGMDKYAEWLLTPHTVKEIIEMRAASGLYKSPGIPGKANDMKMGAFIMGEKGGPFFLNLNGIKETTADKWFTRTYNRHVGTLTQGNVSEQGLVDAPRNEAERAIMKQWNRAVASNIKLDEQANQAVLWYYEQSLYYNLGVKSARSESFSDGAKNLLNARGIPFTESELAGARSLRNARQTSTESTSAGEPGNPISVGQATPAARTKVTRSRPAPKTGAEPGPRVDSIDKFPVGPGSIKPTVIAPDAPLYREMSADNLTDFLRQDNQFSYAAVFVTDNADLALGQGFNKGIKVQFRANAVSGEEHRKPMTGDLTGREYKANVFAPKAIESITFDSEADLKKLKGLPAKVLQTEFERASDGKKNIVFIRKAQGEEKK